MRTLSLLTVVSALFGCAGGSAQTGEEIQGLTQERIDSTQWLYNPQLTAVPIAADELAGPQDGFQVVDLRRFGNEIIACEQGYTGRAVGVWREGKVEQGGNEGQVLTPGGDNEHEGALVTDVNVARQSTSRGGFGPGSRINDGFGLDRFGDTMRRTMDGGDFYVFHPGCV